MASVYFNDFRVDSVGQEFSSESSHFIGDLDVNKFLADVTGFEFVFDNVVGDVIPEIS